MKKERVHISNDPTVLFLISEIMLLLSATLYSLLWGCSLFPRSQVGSLGETLQKITGFAIVLYFLLNLLAILAFLWEGQRRFLIQGERIWADRKVFKHFIFNVACLLLIFLGSRLFLGSAPNGDIPLGPHNTSFFEGPDTKYARAGFQRILRCPVPAHVSQIYFQDRSSFDLDLKLHFNTRNESFVRELIRDLKLNPGGGHQRWEVYTDQYRTLYYDRNSGHVEVTWFTT